MKILIKILLILTRGIASFFNSLKKIFPYFYKPFVFAAQKIGRHFILPFYKTHLYFKRKILNIYSPAKSKVFQLLTKKQVVHILIIALTLFVFVGNINAQETRAEDFGEDTIVFALFNDEKQYELVEEKAVVSTEPKIFSYLDKSDQLENVKVVQDSREVTEEELAEELAAITSGGSAIVKPNINETDLSTAPRTKTITHLVEGGETISTIAERYSISINTVLWANNLSARSVIKPGMELTILPTSGLAHTVKKGDTLSSIAKKYKVDEDKVIEFNKLTDAGSIKIDQDLVIPGGEKPQVIVSRRTYASRPNVSIKNIFTPKPADSTQTVATGKMLWPTSWRVITQYYSWRHHGLDIDGDYSSPIYAAEAGTVTYVGWRGGYGNCVIVNHGGGVVTLYAHLSKFHVSTGQSVGRGATLGMMGTTGWSTGTHLHFEVQINGVKKNPLGYIR